MSHWELILNTAEGTKRSYIKKQVEVRQAKAIAELVAKKVSNVSAMRLTLMWDTLGVGLLPITSRGWLNGKWITFHSHGNKQV